MASLITMAALQRDFGLSFTTASTVLNEQRTLAARRYRALALGAIACNVVLLASYVLGWHWPELLVQSLLLVALLLGVLHLHFTRRAPRAPIVVAARASRAKAATWHE